jgi:endonuclease/exonuclease/phosphatase family metal-dependent hydrolase
VLGPGHAAGTFRVEVRGSVTCGGRPLSEVLLRLDRVADEVVSSTRTDSDGLYAFRFDARPGFYRIVALAPPSEAAPYPGSAQAAFRVLTNGTIGGKPRAEMHVLVPLRALSPGPEESVSAGHVELAWELVEAAEGYRVTLVPAPITPGGDPGRPETHSYRVREPRLALSEGLLPGRRYVWEVEAHGPDGPVARGASAFRIIAQQRDTTGVPVENGRARPPGPVLRMATYNVNWGCPAPGETLAALESLQADIVCVQETNPAWQRLMRARLSRVYPVMWFRHHDLPAGGMAVLSRWRIRELKVLPSASGWFDAARFVADTPLGAVQVLSLHLQPVTVSYEGFSLQAWLASAGARRLEVERFTAGLADGLPTVIAGDLNEGDAGPAVTWLKDRGFRNALTAFQPGVPTWQWPVGAMTVRLQIDHILYSEGLECAHAEVVEAGGSDHFPVLTALSGN